MPSQSTLNQINILFKELQANIGILNNSISSIKKKQKTNSITVPRKDKRKIVKLFQHSSWEQFTKWVNDKLVQSGQNQAIQSTENIRQNNNTKNDTKSQFEETVSFQLTEEFKLSEDQQESISSNRNFHRLALKKLELSERQKQEIQLLALQNGRLRRQNIILKNKLIQIRTSLPQ